MSSQVTREGGVKRINIDCVGHMGCKQCTLEDLKGGDCQENAEILTKIFKGGEDAKGPVSNTIALNAGAGLYVMGMAKTIREGVDIARGVMESGKCWETMESWSTTTQSY